MTDTTAPRRALRILAPLLAPLALAAALAGCTTDALTTGALTTGALTGGGPPWGAAPGHALVLDGAAPASVVGSDAVTPHAVARDLPVGAAVAALPESAGGVVAVSARRRADGTGVQTIALAGDAATRGQNAIEVATLSRMASRRPVSARAIAAELRTAFPGTPMTIDPALRANAYGPFGMAAGADGAARCHYAWQRAGTGRTALDVRVRLCRADLSGEDMAALMERLRLRGATAAPVATRAAAGAFALPSAGGR